MVGKVLGRYQLIEEIGQGGMAVVYRGRVVAVFDQKEADRDRIGLLMAGAA